MKLFLARHGQTDWNLENRAQGQTDKPLNATGIKQAKELRDKLKSYDFDICYSSPLKRALQTAEIAVDGRVKILIDDNLKERNFGKLEGKVLKQWGIDGFDITPKSDEYGMEPIKHLFARSYKVLERIKSENPPDAKILIIAHGVLLKTMHFNIIGYDDSTDFSSFHLKNGEIVEYDI